MTAEEMARQVYEHCRYCDGTTMPKCVDDIEDSMEMIAALCEAALVLKCRTQDCRERGNPGTCDVCKARARLVELGLLEE